MTQIKTISVSSVGKDVYINVYDSITGNHEVNVKLTHKQVKELISGLAVSMIVLGRDD